MLDLNNFSSTFHDMTISESLLLRSHEMSCFLFFIRVPLQSFFYFYELHNTLSMKPFYAYVGYNTFLLPAVSTIDIGGH